MSHSIGSRVGIVVIGRNEGERLRKCLASVIGQVGWVVYVDSGSTDGSAEMARASGVTVVDLDMAAPFTAARARNEGFRCLLELAPNVAYVQFVDGDCEIVAGWLVAAMGYLDTHDDVAVVSGRLRERFPDRSIYNMLCDMEWDRPAGNTRACGGIAMMRAFAFKSVGCFRSDLIAGEEPELCIRLRAPGWRIWSLDQEMALHDAAMMRFSQWWKRAVRGGYAYAEGAYLHGAPPERHGVRESRRAWAWGVFLPLLIFIMSLSNPWAAALVFVYPLQVIRIALRSNLTSKANWWRSLFLVLARFPEGLGQVRFLVTRLRGRHSALIEYK
jgi:glycosyltransferase involved in cell wall biosynthesis